MGRADELLGVLLRRRNGVELACSHDARAMSYLAWDDYVQFLLTTARKSFPPPPAPWARNFVEEAEAAFESWGEVRDHKHAKLYLLLLLASKVVKPRE